MVLRMRLPSFSQNPEAAGVVLPPMSMSPRRHFGLMWGSLTQYLRLDKRKVGLAMKDATQLPFDLSDWMTIDEARRVLGVSRVWIYVLLERGKIRSTRILGRRLLLREDVIAYRGKRDPGDSRSKK